MNKKYITVNIPILDDVEEMKVVETFNQEQLWYVCAIAKAFEKSQQENEKIKNFITNLILKLNHCELNGTKKLDIVSDYIKQEYENMLNGSDEK